MDVSKVRSLSGLSDSLGVSSSSSAPVNTSSTPSETGLSPSFSGPITWMSRLERLLDTDPEKFSEVTATIAEELEDDAADATGEEALLLFDLAARFSEASESGELPALPPPTRKTPPPSGAEVPAPRREQSWSASQAVQRYSPGSISMESVLASVEDLIEAVLQ